MNTPPDDLKRVQRWSTFWTITAWVLGVGGWAAIDKWPQVAGFALLACVPASIIAWRLRRALPVRVRRTKALDAMSDASVATERLAVSKLTRTRNLWFITACFTGVVAFMGNFLPDKWLIVPLIALIVWVPAMVLSYQYRRQLGVRSRKVQSFERCNSRMTLPTRSVPSTSESAVAPRENSAKNEDPPVLYLRSFDEDNVTAKLRGTITEEEHLTRLLTRIGPVIAIGRPGGLPEVGARRIYVNDSDWQRTVSDLIERSCLVVIRTGWSSGLRWEFRKCLDLLRPEQLLLVVNSRIVLDEMLDVIAGSTAMRKRFRHFGWRSIGSIRAFVIFTENWKPILLPARTSLSRWYTDAENDSYIHSRLAGTLRPLFEQLGVPAAKPKISGRQTHLLIQVLFIPLFSLVWAIWGGSEWWQRIMADREGYDPGLILVMSWLLLGLAGDFLSRKWMKRKLKRLQSRAETGDATAQYNLGLLYESGMGIQRDYVSAHVWFNLAAMQGAKGAVAFRDCVGRLMTSDQVTQAKRLANEWTRKAEQR